ncbi:MAG TPA: amino acid adenylation domain-containing protein [Thermoanaerobaculia bacterium]|nr:amino acid adenylation domain-containing protein [Thermoanaerobaculia bacterium]
MTMQGFRLSPQQRRIWELEQVQPGRFAHCALLLEGELDPQTLRRAVQELVDRHEILRTTFRRRAGLRVPLQVITESGEASWSEQRLGPLDPAGELTEVARALEEHRRGQVDYENGAVLDALLLELAPRRHVLSLRLPALCADSRTLANVTREIAASFAHEAGSAADEMVQYLQFSEWQNELLESEDREAGMEFWRKKDLAALPRLLLPFSGAVSAEPSEPAALGNSLGPDLVARIDAAAAAQGADFSSFLLACWQVLLWRITGEPDVVAATVFDGRKFEELEGALGHFAKAVPLHARIEEGFRFADLLRRTHQAVQEAHSWQEFFALEDSGGGEAVAAAVPIAAFEAVEWPALSANGLSISLYRHQVTSDLFQVKLIALRQGEKAILQLEHDPRAVREEDASAMAEQLLTLLASAVAEPGTPVEELEIVSAAERRRIEEFNDTAADSPAGLCLHEIFAEQAARRPGDTALVYENEVLTYAELNARANRLAHRLLALGVGMESRVALLLERSADLVVGLLGTLKAEGAYVPLDPGLPKSRLALLLQQTGASVVVAHQRLVELLPPYLENLIVLDQDTAGAPATDPTGRALPESLAYVLFTSGSTGEPKGVAVEHRQLANYLHGIARRLDLPEGSRFAMVSTFAADLGNTVLFPSLCGGGTLHLFSQERVSDPDIFAGWMREHAIDCVKIVPSHLSNLLAASNPEPVVPRRLLVLGGEASSWSLIDRLRDLRPECRILNHYGPTETTVGVLTHDAGAGGDRRGAAVPLGRPLPNSRVYLLDRNLRPLPTGLTGEIYIGGAGVSRGYLGRPDLTAERFVPDAWSGEPGGRLYRTGDLGRLLPDRTMEFLGRADRQVKVRGFRVELGEVEAALRQHVAVREAVVELRETLPGEHRLVGYIVAQRGWEPSPSDLRGFLQETLPEYMLPAALVRLESLPLTANGKIDRNALPAPEETAAEDHAQYVSPRALGEELLASLWRDVLGLGQLGVHDNFFERGGDSLLATQLMSRVRKTFEVELPVRMLFEAPTVSELAARIERAIQGGDRPEAPPIVPVPRTEDLPLSFAQERLWVMHQLDPQSAAYNSSAPLRLKGPLNERALARALDEIVRRHEILRTVFPSVEGRARQVFLPPAPLPLPRIDLQVLPEKLREREAQRLAIEDAGRPLDLGRGPVLRVSLLRLQPQEHVILFVLHHIVSDGWTTGVLVRELTALYEAFVHDRPSPLPEPAVQYADFAYWQRQWLRDGVMDDLISYWTRQLSGAPESLDLPTDRPRPARQTFRGASLFYQTLPELQAELRELSRKEGVTLFMSVLAAFFALLSRYSEQEDIVVGTDVANRNRIETEGMMGFFINNLVLRGDLSGDPSFRELLARVRTMALGAYAHQDLPFETLVKALRPKRSLSHTPLFQVLFVLQNTPPLESDPRDLQVSLVQSEVKSSKFDLALFVAETPEGLVQNWTYSTELFDTETIQRMAWSFYRLLLGIVRQPDAPISQLEIFSEEERNKRAMEKLEREQSKIKNLGRFRRSSSVDMAEMELVKTEYLQPGSTFPLVVRPNLGDIDLPGWAQDSRDFIDTQLAKHGAILFRGFNVTSVTEFERFAKSVCNELFDEYGDLPREQESASVYHSTPYPNEKTILFHNESSHMHRWPSRQFFYCVKPSEQGGETPIVDCRRMYEALPPEVIQRLEEKQLMYVRNFTEGLDVSWRDFFHTDDPGKVEEYCRAAGMEIEWTSDGLRTRQICPAVITHPKTGEKVFFNQVQLHHVSCLDPEVREAVLSLFPLESLPRNVLYGDGTPIEDSVMEVIGETYWRLAASFPWQKGDVIMLDNMLVAHARNPFVGTRKIVVAMGDMINASDV